MNDFNVRHQPRNNNNNNNRSGKLVTGNNYYWAWLATFVLSGSGRIAHSLSGTIRFRPDSKIYNPVHPYCQLPVVTEEDLDDHVGARKAEIDPVSEQVKENEEKAHKWQMHFCRGIDLSDLHMDHCSALLKEQFPEVDRLHRTSVFESAACQRVGTPVGKWASPCLRLCRRPCLRPVCTAVYVPCIWSCTWPFTACTDRVHRRARAVYMVRPRPCTGYTYTVVYPVPGRVYGRVHGPYTAVNGRVGGQRPCTRVVNTPVYMTAVYGRAVIQPCARVMDAPCARPLHGGVHGPYTVVVMYCVCVRAMNVDSCVNEVKPRPKLKPRPRPTPRPRLRL